ncbi:hypothetical protein NPIL_2441 [Nephila pilipes]|uniref:Uncharacterized protein n=1 Tax=Nephila pilipes TaxID=299642 RepID=A0A8X6UJ59_NEPPI|nr:hypothetical protein NPIL_2441 [Nephila pilipes]
MVTRAKDKNSSRTERSSTVFCAGRQASTLIGNEYIAAVDEMIRNNRRVTTFDIRTALCLSKGTDNQLSTSV